MQTVGRVAEAVPLTASASMRSRTRNRSVAMSSAARSKRRCRSQRLLIDDPKLPSLSIMAVLAPIALVALAALARQWRGSAAAAAAMGPDRAGRDGAAPSSHPRGVPGGAVAREFALPTAPHSDLKIHPEGAVSAAALPALRDRTCSGRTTPRSTPRSAALSTTYKPEQGG